VLWDADLVLWLVDAIEKAGSFAPADFNHRSRIEIRSPSKAVTWFCHILTGGDHLLDVTIRVPKGSFKARRLLTQLGIKTLDDRTDLPIYGQWDRIRIRGAADGWDDVRILLCDFQDVDKAAFKRFLKEAIRAYESRVREMSDLQRGQPWETDGLQWHTSQRSIVSSQRPLWSPAALVSLVGRLRGLEHGLEVSWNSRSAVHLSAKGDATSLIRIATNSAKGLRVEIRAPKNVLTPTQVDKLGRTPKISRGGDHDLLQFWIESMADNDKAQLRRVWDLCRAAAVAAFDHGAI